MEFLTYRFENCLDILFVSLFCLQLFPFQSKYNGSKFCLDWIIKSEIVDQPKINANSLLNEDFIDSKVT